MSDDELEQTRWDKFRSRRSRYEGEERREPTSDALKWVPLITVAIAAAVGYGTLTSAVSNQKEDITELRGQYRDWNVSISQRVRELERGD